MNTVSPSSTAVVGVLLHWDGTENRSILIHDIVITQRTLFELAQKAIPGVSWSVSKQDTVGLAREALAASENDATGLDIFYACAFAVRAALGQPWDCAGRHLQPDNGLLGIGYMTISEPGARNLSVEYGALLAAGLVNICNM